MLGHDVVRVAEGMSHQVVALTHDDLDVTDPAKVERLITRERPGAVINCAAWTNVDGAEESEHDASLVNAQGAGFVADAAAKVDAKLIYPSTDYVFDGTGGPYGESDDTGSDQRLRRDQARWGASHGAGQPSQLHRAHVVALRAPRRQLRRDHAAPRSGWRPGGGRPRSGRLPHLYGSPRGRPAALGRELGVRHPPHGRRGQLLLVRVRPGDLPAGRGRHAGDGDDHRHDGTSRQAAGQLRSRQPPFGAHQASFLAARALRLPGAPRPRLLGGGPEAAALECPATPARARLDQARARGAGGGRRGDHRRERDPDGRRRRPGGAPGTPVDEGQDAA